MTPTRTPSRARRPRRLAGASLALIAVSLVAVPSASADVALRGWGLPNALGINTQSNTPRGVTTLPDAPDADEATGAAVGNGFSFVVVPGDGVYATGLVDDPDYRIALGLGTSIPAAGLAKLARIPGTADVTAAATARDATLLLRTDGTVAAFGINDYGSAGQAPGTPVSTPTTVSGLTNIVQVAAGQQFSVARDRDGAVWAWGRARSLGTGGSDNSATPAKVLLPAGRKAVQIAAGQQHTLALLDDGSVVSWGTNGSGQLGNGSTTAPPTATPVVAVQGLPNGVADPTKKVVQLSAGTATSYALLADGSFRAWGGGGLGLGLGAGADDNKTTAYGRSAATDAIASTNYPKFVELAAQNGAALARTADGRVFGWGNKDNGQLGDPATVKLQYGDPYGTPVANGQSSTEVPQQVLGVRDAPWLAQGGYGSQEIVPSESTLFTVNDFSSPSFLGQAVGTASPTQLAGVFGSKDLPSNITGVSIVGPDKDDFHFTRNTATGGAYIDNDSIGVGLVTSWPTTLSPSGVLNIPLQFQPTAEGPRSAILRVTSDANETVDLPLDGYGLPATSGPKGDKGDAGSTGAKGEKGDVSTVTVTVPSGGTISIASTRSITTVKRGSTAKLPFVLLNGTAGALGKGTATAAVPKALRSSGEHAVTIAALKSGADRSFSVPVKVGKGAKLGTQQVKVTIKVAGKTVVRTTKVRVRR